MNKSSRKAKIRRNDPCPCGSKNASTGKPIKYKKCCLNNPQSPPDPAVMAGIKAELDRQSEARRMILRTKGIFIDFPAPTANEDKAFWALGSRVYYHPKRDITFHEALFFVLSLELGREWIEYQETLPLQERHFILKCHNAYVDFRKHNTSEYNLAGENRWSAVPDGLTKSLLALAFDVSCIIHVHGHLPKGMVERLKQTDSNYQGVRYEIAVAAIFARMGCELEFLDEKFDGMKQIPGHCEFFATEPETQTVIAVEAKSKVRKGILHEPGQAKDFQLWNNVTGPYRNALTQNPETTPFFVFVDVNSPPTPGIDAFQKPWAAEIMKNRKNTPTNKPDNPDPCSAIVYTNYSYHYQTHQEAKANEAIMVIPPYPRHAVPERLLKKLFLVVDNYSFVPNIDYDGTIQG